MAKVISGNLEQAFIKQSKRLKKEKKYGALRNLNTLIKQFVEFKNSADVSLGDNSWLDQYIAFLKNKGNSSTTQKKKVKLIRQVIHRSGPLDPELPDIKFVETEPEKIYLTLNELDKLKTTEFSRSHLQLIRDFFLMQIYLRGRTVSEMLEIKNEDFISGRYHYEHKYSNIKLSMKLVAPAQVIFDRYKNKDIYLFPLLKWKTEPMKSEYLNHLTKSRAKQSATAIINKSLKNIASIIGINKSISSKYARHTFAILVYHKVHDLVGSWELLEYMSLESHLNYMEAISRTERLDIIHEGMYGCASRELNKFDRAMFDHAAYRKTRFKKPGW